MNYINIALTFYSFRKELQYVALAFLVVLMMPVIAVILLTHSGIDIISDRLATVNSQTQAIEIHDPATGEVVKEIHPVVAWPAKGVVTANFGDSTSYQLFHSGIDIASPTGKVGDPISPFMEGEVIYAGEIWWGFGKHIILDHGDNVTSIYAHLDRIFVVKGQKVKLNHIMGHMGSTGWSTGPHLHFQINVYGLPVNPTTFMGNLANGVPIEEADHNH